MLSGGLDVGIVSLGQGAFLQPFRFIKHPLRAISTVVTGVRRRAMGGATAFIEATTAGVTEVLLEHLTRFEGFGAIFDDGFALTIDTVHWALKAYCIYTLALTL
jgi:hypothetical protein